VIHTCHDRQKNNYSYNELQVLEYKCLKHIHLSLNGKSKCCDPYEVNENRRYQISPTFLIQYNVIITIKNVTAAKLI